MNSVEKAKVFGVLFGGWYGLEKKAQKLNHLRIRTKFLDTGASLKPSRQFLNIPSDYFRPVTSATSFEC